MDEKKYLSKTFPSPFSRLSSYNSDPDKGCKGKQNYPVFENADEDSLELRTSEVLKMKIKMDENNHEIEKNMILEESGRRYQLLENENENLTVKTLDQERHIQRIGSASERKDKEIEELKRKAHQAQNDKRKFEQMKEELSDKIDNLEEQMQQSTQINSKQREEIEKLKNELTWVESELKKLRHEQKFQNCAVGQQIKDLKAEMQRQFEQQSDKLMSQMTSLMTKNGSETYEPEPTVNITTAEHVQVSINHSNGKNAMNVQKKVCTPKQFIPDFSGDRKRQTVPKMPMHRKNGPFGGRNQQKTE